MLLLLSGEGSSDMGSCANGQSCCIGGMYRPGAMALILDKLINLFQGFEFSYIDSATVRFVSEQYLIQHKPVTSPKFMNLSGKKKAKETQYFFANARALATEAKRLSEETGDKVLAVLFRDSDGTASSGRGEWQAKRDSMVKGFEVESYKLGVAMIPKPKSEAWLICALKDTPYQACAPLEDRSGNDDSPNALKPEFNDLVNNHPTGLPINDLILQGHINTDSIDMNSMNDFKADLKRAVECVFPQGKTTK